MSIKKQYLKSKPLCKVSFRVPKEVAKSAETAFVVGEFNNWDTNAAPMKRHKNGTFSASIDLELGKEYQFRYLLDKSNWETDFTADKYVPTPFGNSENSVIIVENNHLK